MFHEPQPHYWLLVSLQQHYFHMVVSVPLVLSGVKFMFTGCVDLQVSSTHSHNSTQHTSLIFYLLDHHTRLQTAGIRITVLELIFQVANISDYLYFKLNGSLNYFTELDIYQKPYKTHACALIELTSRLLIFYLVLPFLHFVPICQAERANLK